MKGDFADDHVDGLEGLHDDNRYNFSIVELVVGEVLPVPFALADLPDARDGEVAGDAKEQRFEAGALPLSYFVFGLEKLLKELFDALLGGFPAIAYDGKEVFAHVSRNNSFSTINNIRSERAKRAFKNQQPS